MADYLSNQRGRISPNKTSQDSNLKARKNLIRGSTRRPRKSKRS